MCLHDKHPSECCDVCWTRHHTLVHTAQTAEVFISINAENLHIKIPFYEETKINRSVLLYRRMSNELPTYLNDLLIRNCDIHKCRMRYSSSNFICPRIKHKVVEHLLLIVLGPGTLLLLPLGKVSQRNV